MQYRKVEELKRLENNPRYIKEEDFERLRTSIKNNPEYFEARPIILSDRTGELVIIAGNQRYQAALDVGLKEVPTFLLENLNEEKEREIIIRDNVANGDFDHDILANEWNIADLAEWGVEIPEIDLNEEDDKVECPSCGSKVKREKITPEIAGE